MTGWMGREGSRAEMQRPSPGTYAEDWQGSSSSDNCFHLRVQGRAGKDTQNSLARKESLEKLKKVEKRVYVS
jgi:hypothetical protein